MADGRENQPDWDISNVDPRDYLTTRDIVEDEFGKASGNSKARHEEAIHRIEVAVEVLTHQCGFNDEDLFEIIRYWEERSERLRAKTLSLLKADIRAQYLTAVIGELIDDEGTFPWDDGNLERIQESMAALGQELIGLPPLQKSDQFNVFGRRVYELSRLRPEDIGQDIRYETRRIDIALIDTFESFEVLTGRQPLHREENNDRNEWRGESGPGVEKGKSSYADKPPRHTIVSNVMERGDQIAKLSDESLQMMRIVLTALEERRSNDPAEGELKERLVLLIEQVEEARDATVKAAQSGIIEDAETAAEKIEKGWTLLDQKLIDSIKDIGVKSVSGSLCFGLALGATATFAAAGFPIPTWLALTVSGSIFGVKGIANAVSGSKGSS